MLNLNFDIYIGKKLVSGQDESIAAVAVQKFFIPKGKFDLDGTPLSNTSSMDCFKNLYDLCSILLIGLI